MPDNELYHHGIKGMKWGVRRFQRPDGSLTAMGRARQRLQDASDKHKAKKAEEARAKADKALRKKPISKLTDEELKARISRLEMEKKLVDLEKNTADRAEKSSRVKSFMSVVGKEVVKPAVINAARNTVQNYLNSLGGNLVKDLLKDVGVTSGNKPKKNKQNNDSGEKPNNKTNKDSGNKPKNNPVNKPQKPNSTEKTVDADYKETGPQKKSPTSNSNATSVTNLYNSGYRMGAINKAVSNAGSTSVSSLYSSGYRMSSTAGKSAIDRLANSGWTMRSLDELEKYN